jgi:hypothetical protein
MVSSGKIQGSPERRSVKTDAPRDLGNAGCVVSGARRDQGAEGPAERQREPRRRGLVGCPSGQREQTVNLPASRLRRFESFPHHFVGAGVAQLVEHQPSKLRVTGSSPVARLFARVAQSAERVLGKDEVTGSIPVASFWETSDVSGQTSDVALQSDV